MHGPGAMRLTGDFRQNIRRNEVSTRQLVGHLNRPQSFAPQSGCDRQTRRPNRGKEATEDTQYQRPADAEPQ